MAAKQKSGPKPAKKTTTVPAKTPQAVKAKAPTANRTNTFPPGFWKTGWMPALALLGLAFAIYAVSISFGYILDDEMVIWGNAFVQKGFSGIGDILNADSFLGYFQDERKLFLLEGGRYRPLSLITFAAELGIFGAGDHLAHISHFINILLYGLTGVLLYRILSGLFPLQAEGKWYFGMPFIASVLFMVHPLHVECVANIKGRDEILALLGSLGALYATLKYLDTTRFLWLVLSGVLLFLGLMAKENAITFLVVIPLTLYFFTGTGWGRAFSVSAPLFIAALAFIFVRYQALGFMVDHGRAVTDLMNDPFMEMNLGQKFATIFLTLGWYIKLLFIPHPLTHDYYPYHVPKVDWSDWRALASLVMYMGMGIWAVLNIQKKKVAAYAILFWLATLSIVSNIVVSVGSFMNDRFAYMPSVAFCLLAGWFFARQLPQRIKEKQDRPYVLGLIVFGAIAALFAYRSFTRVPDWKDAMSLNRSAVKVSENSARAQSFFVTSLYKEVYLKEKNPAVKAKLVDTMEYHIQRAIKINPNYGAAQTMRAAVAAARFEQDHQLDKFFHEIESIIEKIPYNTNFRDFLDQYMKYLDGSNSDKYVSFCHRVGYEYFYKKKQDFSTALHFLQFGLDRQTEDIRILEALADVYTAMNDQPKAAEMRARANAAK